MSQNGDAGYDDTHRAFLQALLARQTITYEQAKPLLAAIQSAQDEDRPTLPEDISLEDFEQYIDTLNTHISPFDLEIRNTLHQRSKERVYALVNTTSDALTQMATMRTADEIAFVKRVLDCMFETNNTQRAEIMALTGMQALKLAKAPPPGERRRESLQQTQTQQSQSTGGLTMSQAERVLQNMVAEGWFELSQKGYYSLSPRALMELKGWLVEAYNAPPAPDEDDEDEEEVEEHQKIKFCHACKQIVTVGQRCPDLACPARAHDHCVSKIFRAQGGREECPVCKKEWVDAPPVGEKAARSGGRRTTNGSTGGRHRTSNMGTDGAPDESDAVQGADEV